MAFLGVKVGIGQINRMRVPLGEYSDGTEILLPVVTIGGGQEGPTLFVQAGLHGDEQTGIAICRSFLASLDGMDLAQLRGRIVVVPIANPPSHLSRSRGYLHEERRMVDLNRIFPGQAAGLISERIASALFEEFVRPSDFVIDLHSALDGCTIAPFVYVDPDDDESGTLAIRERIAWAFGTPFVYYKRRGTNLGTSNMSGGLHAQTDRIGKPELSAEMGQSQVVTREYVRMGVDGVHNVMHALEMSAGEPKPAPAQQRRFSQIHLLHANRGGGFVSTVTVGDMVEEGALLGAVSDVYGQVIEEFRSPVTGFVLRLMLWGTVATGAEVFWVAT